MGIEQTSSALDFLKGYNVNLYVGEEGIKGKLIGVETDHVIIENENNNIFYYNIDQIQAISKNTKQFQSEEATTEFLQTQSLFNLLDSLKNSWVTILCLNKQKFNGIVSCVDKHFVTLIGGEERILIKLSHISNILKGYIKEEKNSNQADSQEKKEENKNEHQNEAASRTEDRPIEILGESKKMEAPVISGDIDQESRVWSQSIRTGSEKQNDSSSRKNKNELKKAKEDSTSSNKKETSTSIGNETREVRQKEETQKVRKEGKEVKEVKATKEEKGAVKQEPSKVMELDPFLSPLHFSHEKSKSSQSKKDDSAQKETIKNASRFAGEPVSLREIERPSIFAGWPGNQNRKNRF